MAITAIWLTRGKATAAPTQTASNEQSIPAIEFLDQDTYVIESRPLVQQMDISGTVSAVSQAVVKSRIAGEVSKVFVKEGDFVKAGQLLAQLDLLEVQARLKEKTAIAASNQAQADLAQKNLDKNQQLLSKNFVSEVAVDNAASNLSVAKAQLDAALAQVALAQKQLSDATVRAPISGQVAERTIQAGEKTAIDAKLFSIVDLSQLEVSVSVPSADIGRVSTGQMAELQIEGISNPQKAKVVRINPATASGSRSVPIYLALQQPSEKVRAGLFAQGKLTFASAADVLAVPIEAIREINGQTAVYQLSPNNVLVISPVSLGLKGIDKDNSRAWVEIKSGLKQGDRIVSKNLGPLRENAPVKVAQNSRPDSNTTR